MMDNPCHGCLPPERYPGCWCQAKKDWDAERAALRREQAAQTEAKNYEIERVYKVLRHRGKHPGERSRYD
jgi:hypothetical protein